MSFSNTQASSSTYNCLSNFHNQFSEDFQNSSYKRHVEGYEIRKRRVRNQNVIVANLIDPVDDKSKKLFVTKTKARVCDPSAETGNRCSEPQERHINASLGRHISVLPDVYRSSLRQYRSTEDISDAERESISTPNEIMNSLSECKRLSRTIRRRVMMKSRAIASVYQDVFGIKKDDSSEAEDASVSQPSEKTSRSSQ